MQTALQLFVTTLQIGAVYILFSLGLTLVFGILRVVNFVHGHFFAVTALMVGLLVPKIVLAGYSIQSAYLISAAGGILVSMTLAVIVYKFGISRFLRDLEGGFILTMGLALVLDGAFLQVFGGTVRSIPPVIEGNMAILGAVLTTQRFVLCAIAALMTGGLYWILAATKLGKALRAVAADREAAMLQGIPYNRLALVGFLLAAMMAALAGVLIAPVSMVTPTMGTDYLMKSFVAIVMGGLGSVPGAIVGALLISVIEAVGGYFFDASTATIAMFSLVILVLVFRPRGLIPHA
ncbi:branched-chain amino acid ABC transporter permease [Paraburkholderia sp. NPDC080076]|uniref:branched-chain amino acid ABC transporter permease n=1 Tax=Paraburkholderia sp. NPDC080076 TaxID=3390605 RepID=UPI003D043C70